MKVITIVIVGLCIAAGLAFLLLRTPEAGVAEQSSVQEPAVTETVADPPANDPDAAPSGSNEFAAEPADQSGNIAAVDLAPEAPVNDQAPAAPGPDVPLTPSFDVVRIDPNGQAVVAGQAVPGSMVEIVLDGDVVARETVDQSGNFVSLFSVPVTDEARSLVLRGQGVVATSSAPKTIQPLAQAPSGAAPVNPDPSSAPEPSITTAAASLPTGSIGDEGVEIPSDPGLAGVDVTGASPAGLQAGSVDSDLPVPDTVLAQRSDTASAALTGAGVESAQVLILPSGVAGEAPAIVQPEAGQLALLQATGEQGDGVRLDRISYSKGGAVDLLGRAEPGNQIRVYVNAELVGAVDVVPAGQWRAVIAAEMARGAKLLRFDEVETSGAVVNRIETPFVYEQESGPKTLAERNVEIERGDYLWRIAERYYGEGIRYSVIFSANASLIKDPNLIYPGQVFTVPELVDSE